MITGVKKKCKFCKETIYPILGEVNRGYGKFCNLKCVGLFKKGKKVHLTKEWRANISKAMKGRKFTEEHKKKISLAHKGTKKPWNIIKNKLHSGENSWNWKGGISPILTRIRQTEAHQKWRELVYKRDNYTCIWCFRKGGWNKEEKRNIVLNADHIKPFSIFPELRLKLSNGQTLCKLCHKIKTKKDWEMIKKIRKNFKIYKNVKEFLNG